jgi:SAM-dependent methyltransferase
MIAMDLKDTPTMAFLKWRVKEKGLEQNVTTCEFETPVPPDLGYDVDGVVMISVIDHLWDPMGSVKWITRHVKKGGWMLCDTWANMKQESNPQHLVKYDPHKILHEFKRLGWKTVPENPFLFIKEA